MIAIYKKEMRNYFLTPLGYIFVGAFMLVAGIYFSLTNVIPLNSNFASTLGSLTFIFIIVIPVLTMKLISQEAKEKTDQLLMTSPIGTFDIVAGKYLAAISVFLVAIVISLIFPFVIAGFGAPIYGEVFTCYIGFLLLGCSLIALGMFISSCTDSMVVAAIICAFVMMLMWVGDAAISLVPTKAIANILLWFSVFSRLEGFVLGQMSLVPILYYIGFISLFVLATYLNVERTRWDEK